MPVGGSEMPDFSAMMFPTSDPFAYPNQPMTTLEDAHLGPNDANAPLLPSSPTTAQPPGTGYADGMDMQIFGMPPYLMQGQQPSLGLGLGLFDGEPLPGGMDGNPWVLGADGAKGDVDWGSWGEGNFGG